MPEYEDGISKLKMLETSDVISPKYEVPYAFSGAEELTGTMRCGYCHSPVRVVGQLLASCVCDVEVCVFDDDVCVVDGHV